jgi:hypothetical protein
MSGGTYEYVAGYNSGTPGSSGFTTDELTTYSKYLDVYTSSTSSTDYSRRILGDATGEMGTFYYSGGWYMSSWYKDYARFVYTSVPWFTRGGSYVHASYAGQFFFVEQAGAVSSDSGSRLVLTLGSTYSLVE